MRTIRNCNVCVVGGAGFLGSHLVDHLVDDRGCDVLVLDNLVAGRREFVHRKARFVHADITGSEEYLRQLFTSGGHAGTRIDYVFNYAAYPYVPDSYARPLHVFNVNATGALKVINAAQEAGCKGILQVSSAELYGDGVAGWQNQQTGECTQRIREHVKAEPHSTYGAAKAAVDALCQVRWREAKTPVIALRQFNCVGERETHPYVVPEIISQLARLGWRGVGQEHHGIAVARLGNNSTRDFLYAGDAVRIAVELLERGQWGEVYNLGSEEGVKIYDLAEMVGEVMGFADVRVELDEARVRPWEIWSLLADNSKLNEVLGWKSKIDREGRLVPLREALRRTVAWFEGNGRRWPWEG